MKKSYLSLVDMNLSNGTAEPTKITAGTNFSIEERFAPKLNVEMTEDWKKKIDDLQVTAGVATIDKVIDDEILHGNKKMNVDIVVDGTMPAGTKIIATLKNATGVELDTKTVTLGAITSATSSTEFKFKKPLNSNLVGIEVQFKQHATVPYAVDVLIYDEADTDLDNYLPSQERPGYLPVKLGENAILD